MGGKSNPLDDLKKVIDKGATDVKRTFDSGATTVNQANTEFWSKADGGITKNVLEEGFRKINGEGIILDPNVKASEGAKDEARADSRQREAASVKQEQDRKDLLRVKSANAEAGEGSSIILGSKGKKKKSKGSAVSSGMGLSSGSTGLQT
jgi:hypothetical protein|tara:strand:+ start:440 stop:889 length:450 start_codon:yes stop_codon:yes gene_type:complete